VTTIALPQDISPETSTRTRAYLIALHVPFLVLAPALTITGFEGRPHRSAVVVIPLALALGALQFRHSLAAARGERPVGWPLTFIGIVALVYIPMWWFTWNWQSTQWFVVASAAMLLRGWLAAFAVAVPIIGTVTMNVHTVSSVDNGTIGQILVLACYAFTFLCMGGIALYGAARLVNVVDEYNAARLELAELAVGRERLRVSRDLHDLLGQSLSAVSLKGDLAMRLLPNNEAGAHAEIESLTGVARSALRGMRAIARDEHTVSLPAEVDAAAALLGAAGIDAHVDVDLPPLAGAIEDVLAWAIREGTTNILRHSDAHDCWITATRTNGDVRLEIVNDGARQPLAAGTGLVGLAERAEALSGSAVGSGTRDGRFRLVVVVPERLP
jgi:two-component system sensor histidine kinase DesK